MEENRGIMTGATRDRNMLRYHDRGHQGPKLVKVLYLERGHHGQEHVKVP
jgi:hypothetical protein